MLPQNNALDVMVLTTPNVLKGVKSVRTTVEKKERAMMHRMCCVFLLPMTPLPLLHAVFPHHWQGIQSCLSWWPPSYDTFAASISLTRTIWRNSFRVYLTDINHYVVNLPEKPAQRLRKMVVLSLFSLSSLTNTGMVTHGVSGQWDW
jgi:hypothetical protein